MTILIRELPPLRVSYEVITPSGRHYRWADDEQDPANVPSGERWSSTMPGGHESFDAVLPRKSSIDYSDLKRLTEIRADGASGERLYEGRLERTPKTSGDQMVISPSAVGFQAALDDDKSATFIGVDRDLTAFTAMPATRLAAIASTFHSTEATVRPGAQLDTGFDENGGWSITNFQISEAWYNAGSARVARIRANWNRYDAQTGTAAPWTWQAYYSDDFASGADVSGNLAGAGPGSVDFSSTAPRKAVVLQFYYGSGGGAAGGGRHFAILWDTVLVFGDHGLTMRSATYTDENAVVHTWQGLFASDMVTYVVNRWAPTLNTTGSVTPSRFVVPQAVYRDMTTAGTMVNGLSRYELQDWAVWDDKQFWWFPRGTYGRTWRARVAPAQLTETGPQVDRLWNSVVVQYTDVDGTTKTTGPIGSNADVEDSRLTDADPDNDATLAGITRRDMLVMGTSTSQGAITVGQIFLRESKALDRSGQAKLVGHVLDSHGVMHPYHHVRAGDTIIFPDAADPSPRRIVKAEHDRASRTCTVDLDAPPEGLQALLERLGAVLAPLGIIE